MIKDMVDRMAEGETLEISYQSSPSTVATMYVKMDRNRCNVLYRKKRSYDWGLIVLHPICVPRSCVPTAVTAL